MGDKNLVYLNGEIRPLELAGVCATDAGLMYGWGVFETLRIYKGKAIMLDKHISRLLHSATRIGINLSMANGLEANNICTNNICTNNICTNNICTNNICTNNICTNNICTNNICTNNICTNNICTNNICTNNIWEHDNNTADFAKAIESEIERYINEVELVDSVVRITLAKGSGANNNLIFTNREIPYVEEQYSRGFHAGVSRIMRNSSSPLSYIKSTNYLENILAKEEAIKEGFDEAIMINTEGYLCEGSMSNLFFIKGDVLYTPAIKCGLLPGIVRGIIVDGDLVSLVEEGQYKIERLFEADEAFLTNSVMGIMPLVSVDGRMIGSGKLGMMTREIRAKLCLFEVKT